MVVMGFCCYKVKNPSAETLAEKINWPKCKSVFTSKYAPRRDITQKFTIDMKKWGPGQFVIIPTAHKPGQEAKFFCRIFVEQDHPDSDASVSEDED